MTDQTQTTIRGKPRETLCPNSKAYDAGLCRWPYCRCPDGEPTPTQPTAEQFDPPIWKGYRRIIRNHSGVLDISPRNGSGVWVVIEDRQDICSIGMTAEELEAFITAAREIANG